MRVAVKMTVISIWQKTRLEKLSGACGQRLLDCFFVFNCPFKIILTILGNRGYM
jgi:hypothetical protein